MLGATPPYIWEEAGSQERFYSPAVVSSHALASSTSRHLPGCQTKVRAFSESFTMRKHAALMWTIQREGGSSGPYWRFKRYNGQFLVAKKCELSYMTIWRVDPLSGRIKDRALIAGAGGCIGRWAGRPGLQWAGQARAAAPVSAPLLPILRLFSGCGISG